MAGLRSQASSQPLLTQYAQGYSIDKASALAEFIAPTVRVASALGHYKSFDEKNAFQIYDTARAIGGKAKRIEFKVTDPTYNAEPQALEIALDDAETARGGGSWDRIAESKTRTLVSSAVLSHEDKVITLAKTVSAVAGVGQWSDTDADPVSELDAQIEAIANATGMMPTAIVFGLGAWRVFKHHKRVLALTPGAASANVTPELAASWLLNPQIQLRIGVMSKDTTKFGATASKQNIIGAEVFIFLRSANPTEMDPSWIKTFTAGEGGVDQVLTYRDESASSDILVVRWTEDIKITSSIGVKRITIT